MNKKNEKVEKKVDTKKVETKKTSTFKKKKKVKKNITSGIAYVYSSFNNICLSNSTCSLHKRVSHYSGILY